MLRRSIRFRHHSGQRLSNGVVAVPVMVLMMLLTANTKVMGQFTVTGVLRFTGWLATAVMAAAVACMLVTAVL